MSEVADLALLYRGGMKRTRSQWPLPTFEPPPLEGIGSDFVPTLPSPDEVAFVQFSSGTTALPKPIVMSHRQVLFNARAMLQHLNLEGCSLDAGAVCWLPLHHDMGFVGCLLNPIVRPMNIHFLSPETFLARPWRWLEVLSQTGAFASPAPCFALARCLEVSDGLLPETLDLSRWRRLICGADRVDASILEAFAARFSRYGFDPAAFVPAYGLAEAGLAVTMGDPERGVRTESFAATRLASGVARAEPHGIRLVSNGRPIRGYEVRVADPSGGELDSGLIGRVLIRGGSVLAGTGSEDGWYDTGDDGFLDRGELFITGRRKDMIIVNGANYSAQQIEAVAVEGLSESSTVAAIAGRKGFSGGEGFVLFAERSSSSQLTDEQLDRQLRHNLGVGLGLVPMEVVLTKANRLPRTTSGKIRRVELAGKLQSAKSGSWVF